jgi:hypothetical protein
LQCGIPHRKIFLTSDVFRPLKPSLYERHTLFLLCRTPLPPGPEKLYEQATLRYVVVKRRMERGQASWGALTKDEQRELNAAVGGWRAAADKGFAQAQ